MSNATYFILEDGVDYNEFDNLNSALTELQEIFENDPENIGIYYIEKREIIELEVKIGVQIKK